MILQHLYWCTNQASCNARWRQKALAEGGAPLTAVLKMLDLLVLVLWLIAFHLYQDLLKADMAYPTLVNNVLPVPMVVSSARCYLVR